MQHQNNDVLSMLYVRYEKVINIENNIINLYIICKILNKSGNNPIVKISTDTTVPRGYIVEMCNEKYEDDEFLFECYITQNNITNYINNNLCKFSSFYVMDFTGELFKSYTHITIEKTGEIKYYEYNTLKKQLFLTKLRRRLSCPQTFVNDYVIPAHKQLRDVLCKYAKSLPKSEYFDSEINLIDSGDEEIIDF